tara:strand:+ start:52 stop:7071 length:7020 start_codon:yes stop_codon:yes gene_type:complete
MSNHGIIPAQETTCILDIHVSDIDCSPSRDLAKQVVSGSGVSIFDAAEFAKNDYTVLTLAYISPERISGFQCEIEIPQGHTHIVAVGTAKADQISSQMPQAGQRQFFVFNSKNIVFGVINPEINGAATSASYNLRKTVTANVPMDLCYVVLAKSKFYTDDMCPSSVNIKSYKACRNITTSDVSILSQPASSWKGFIGSTTINLSNLYHIANLVATKTYHINLDANEDGNRFLDILDITALANKIHNLQWNRSSADILPEYICKDQQDFMVNADLETELEIMSVNLALHEDNSGLYDFVVEFGLRSSNTTAGIDFVFGRDIFDTSKGTETVEFIGPLLDLKDTWGYKFVSIRNRFNRDVITRIIAYQMPIDTNKVAAERDFTVAEDILRANSLDIQESLIPVIRYTLSGVKLEGEAFPERRYYYTDRLSADIQDQREIKAGKQKNARYYGPVNVVNNVYYTGEEHNPNKSRRLNVKWDVFELFNAKVVTNDFLSYVPHMDNKLQYLGFNLIYNPDPEKLLTFFENNLESYYKYLINYLYNPLNKGLDTLSSEYHCEPSGSVNPAHNGYVSDADLTGYHDIVDLITFSNLGTQKLSATTTSALTFLQELSRNEAHLQFHDKIDSSSPTSVIDNSATKSALKSLTKVIPTGLLRNYTTTTTPPILPSIREQDNSAILFFTEAIHLNSAAPDQFFADGTSSPPAFRNWQEYFNDLHNIKYYDFPPVRGGNDALTYIEVKLATNNPDINFITSTEFLLDFSNCYLRDYPAFGTQNGSEIQVKKFWILPGDAFPTSSYNLTVRSYSPTGSIRSKDAYFKSYGFPYIPGGTPGQSGIYPKTGSCVHIKLDISGSETLAAPITYDGGGLTILKLFLQEKIGFENGEYFGFGQYGNGGEDNLTRILVTGSVESVGAPLERSGSVGYLQYQTSNRLTFGPSASYMTRTEINPDNSASPRHFGDALLRLRAVTPSTFDLEYETLKPFTSASCDIKAINNIEIDSIIPTIGRAAETGYTASFSTGSANDGISSIVFNVDTGLDLTGSGTLLRFKTNRPLFPSTILEEDKEFVSPPKGDNLDLVVPNIDKTFIFPTVDNLIFHIDASDTDYVKTVPSGSPQLPAVNIVANPYDQVTLSQSATASMPLYTNASSSFATDMMYISFDNTGSQQYLSSSIDIPYGSERNLKQLSFICVFEPTALSGSFTKTLFRASSSLSRFEIGLRGQDDIPPEGGIYMHTSGSWPGGTAVSEIPFSANTGSVTNHGLGGNILVITVDGRGDGFSYLGANSNIRLNGSLVSVSSSVGLSCSDVGSQRVNYMIGSQKWRDIVTPPRYFYEGNVGEIILFNDIISSGSIELFEAYAAHKWGLTSKLPDHHKYKYVKPDVSNTTVNNSASKAAIQLHEDYFSGNANASNRASSRILSKYIVIDDVMILSSSNIYMGGPHVLRNPDYNLFREIPSSISTSSVGTGDGEVFIDWDCWDPAVGKLKIKYTSRSKIDGYQIELGNVRPTSSLNKLIGITRVDKKEIFSETSKRKWTEYLGFSSEASEVYNKDPNIINSPHLIAFGFSDGPIEKTNIGGKDNYNLSSWALPKTPEDESKLLTVLDVDPSSFIGQRPTLKSFELFTNDNAVTPTGSWMPGIGTKVGFDNLQEVIQLVQYGFINSGSSKAEITASAITYDASGSGGNLKVDSVLAVWNHLVLSSGMAAKDTSLKIVPRYVSDFRINSPGTPTVTASIGTCTDILSASISWTTSSGGGIASGYEIYRRATVQKPDGSTYLWTGKSDDRYQNTTPYQHIATINTGSTTTFVDRDPPQNKNCCNNSDNPEIEYLVIAFGFGGETEGRSNKVQAPCCNAVPTVSDITITSSINRKIPFNIAAVSSDAPAPFGSTDPNISVADTLKFSILKYANGKMANLKSDSGKFEFKPNRNFVGKTQLTYQISNKAGCSVTGSAYFAITPSNFTPTASLLNPLGGNNTNIHVLLHWERSKVLGRILKYEIFKAVSGSTYSTEPSASIPGDFLVGEENVNYYDPFTPPSVAVRYKYKVRATGFSGPLLRACEEDRCTSIETDDFYITVPARVTASNPTVTLSSSFYTDANHPEVKLSWVSQSAGARKAQYYNVYRTIKQETQYRKISTIPNNGTANYVFFDYRLPPARGRYKYGIEDYIASYRVTSVSDDGENGDPNSGWTGNTYAASISGSAIYPVAENRVLPGVCAGGPALYGDVSLFVYNNDNSTTTTYSASALSGLNFDTSTGAFKFSNSTPGAYSFNYSATSGDKTSLDGTITLLMLDCIDEVPPPGTKESHVIVDAYDIQGEQAKTVDQVPFSLREPGGQNIRDKSKAYAVSKGEIKTDDE